MKRKIRVFESIGVAIRYHRERKEFTRKHLAEISGVTHSFIRDLELGIHEYCGWPTVVKISQALAVPLAQFVQVAVADDAVEVEREPEPSTPDLILELPAPIAPTT